MDLCHGDWHGEGVVVGVVGDLLGPVGVLALHPRNAPVTWGWLGVSRCYREHFYHHPHHPIHSPFYTLEGRGAKHFVGDLAEGFVDWVH